MMRRATALWVVRCAVADVLLGRAADTSTVERPRFVGAPVTECFAGEATARVFADGSGAGLGSFTAFASVRARGCAATRGARYNASADAPWYVGGCSLLNGIFAARPPPAWPAPHVRSRRATVESETWDALEAEAAKRPVSAAMRAAERQLHAARRSGSRADWGLSLANDGFGVLFGTGRRDFAPSTGPGTPLGTARSGVDATIRGRLAASLFDGEWHDVVARRTVRRNGADLELWVDGARVASGFAPIGAFDGGGGAGALHDAPARVPVGQLLVGCVRGASVAPTALPDAAIGAAFSGGDAAASLRGAAPARRVQREYPTYFSARTDAGSQRMTDLFAASLDRNSKRLVPRQSSVSAAQRTMAERFGTKTALVATALATQDPGTFAVVTELDVRFFGGAADVADLVDDAIERCGDDCDAVFQREDDTSLHRNLGFMAIRVSENMRRFFEVVGAAAATSGKVRGGVHRGPGYPEIAGIKAPTDQMCLNVGLYEPEKLFEANDPFVTGRRPALKSNVFPAPEVATRAFLLQLALRYKHKGGFALYHVNDFGGIEDPAKARDAKLVELDIVERGVYKARAAAASEHDATAKKRDAIRQESGGGGGGG